MKAENFKINLEVCDGGSQKAENRALTQDIPAIRGVFPEFVYLFVRKPLTVLH